MNASTSSRGSDHSNFTDVLRAGTSIDFQTAHLSGSTAVLAATLQEGGVMLTIDGTVTHGQLWLTEAMIAAAEPCDDDGECWELRHGGVMLLFFAGSEPAPERDDERAIDFLTQPGVCVSRRTTYAGNRDRTARAAG